MVGGTLISEPEFTPAINANFVGTGNDYIRNDPDGKRMRLNAHGVVKTHDDAVSYPSYTEAKEMQLRDVQLIYLHYTGTVTLTEGVIKVFSGNAGDVDTPYGDSCMCYAHGM